MKTRPTPARPSRPLFRHAAVPALVAAALIGSACSSDDPASVEPTVLGEVDGTETTMPEDEPSLPEVDPPVEEELPVEGEPPVVEDVPPAQDDRAGLNVLFPADREVAELSSPWLAVVDVFQNSTFPDTTGDLFVELLRYDDGLDFETSAAFYTRDLDTCEIDDPEPSEEGEGEEDDDDGVRSVSGGDAVELTSAGGTWLSVPFSPEDGVYDHGDSGFPEAVPADLALRIPGAEFPGIDALPIALPNAPVRLSPPIGEAVTPATEYLWMPETDGSIMRIVFKNFVDGDFQGFPIGCRVIDDGAFELPEDVLDALAELPGETTVRFSRETNRLEFRDGVAVFQSVDLADD